MISKNYPSIVKAALEISYDNGGINRFRTEEQMLSDLENFLKSQDTFTLQYVEKDLISLTEEEFQTACTGEQTEREELYLLKATDDLLNEIFEKVGQHDSRISSSARSYVSNATLFSLDLYSMDKEITIRKWVKRGIMRVATDALDYDDPDHEYNQVLAQGVKPEDYGLVHPLDAEFGDKSRGQLIQEILELRNQIRSMCYDLRD